MSRFANVPAKVTQYMPPRAGAPGSPGARTGAPGATATASGSGAGAGALPSHSFLKKNSRPPSQATAAAAPAGDRSSARRASLSSKPAVPRRDELAAEAPAPKAAAVDYVRENSREVLKASAALQSQKESEAAAPSGQFVDKQDYGKVPA